MEPLILGALAVAAGAVPSRTAPEARLKSQAPESTEAEKTTAAQPTVAPSSEPRAILPNGRALPPHSMSGGFHGTNIPPEVATKEGLPARGNDWRLLEHTQENPDSAFRGTTAIVSDPVNEGGAAYWAGEGGYVYEIRGVPTWDVNQALEGQVPTPGGYRGNIMYGENELAIPARVPAEKIVRWGVVKSAAGGRLRVEWHTKQ
jgi:hypothetical protein